MVPTLEEMRKWLQGHEVDGLPEREGSWSLEPERKAKDNPYNAPAKQCARCQGTGEWSKGPCVACDGQGWIQKRSNLADNMAAKHRAKQRGGRYVVSADGKDALIHFGKHNGKNLSDIAKIDRGYLSWIIGEDFPKELKDICEYQLKLTNAMRRRR
jgi:hypothetical protein